MVSRDRWIIVSVVLVFVFLGGLYVNNNSGSNMNQQTVSITTCNTLPNYDFKQMLTRVEKIKGKQLQRNLSICTETEDGGIDTTPNHKQFARVTEPGMSFFGLNATANSQRRSSLGYTTFSPSGGPIKIFLANKTVFKNNFWISYEGLVVHELSDAIEVSESTADEDRMNVRAQPSLTTDEILARQALSNGVSTYVAELYTDQYGGFVNVSVLEPAKQNWKRQFVQSVYYSGYYYSKQHNQRTVPENRLPNSTAQILHPKKTVHIQGAPPRPVLTIDSLKHIRTDRVGELFLRETFRSKGINSDRAAATAAGWTNDRMDYYQTNTSTVVTWRVTWENTQEIAEFLTTYDAVYDYKRVDSLRSVTCQNSARYLSTSNNTVTVVLCGRNSR